MRYNFNLYFTNNCYLQVHVQAVQLLWGELGDLERKEDAKAMTKQMQHRTMKNTEKRPYVYSHDSAQPSTNTTKPYDYENFSFIYIFYYSYYMYFNMPIILLPILPNLPMRHEPT